MLSHAEKANSENNRSGNHIRCRTCKHFSCELKLPVYLNCSSQSHRQRHPTCNLELLEKHRLMKQVFRLLIRFVRALIDGPRGCRADASDKGSSLSSTWHTLLSLFNSVPNGKSTLMEPACGIRFFMLSMIQNPEVAFGVPGLASAGHLVCQSSVSYLSRGEPCAQKVFPGRSGMIMGECVDSQEKV